MKIEKKEQQDALVAAVKQWFRERHAERQVDDSKKDNTTFRWFKKKVCALLLMSFLIISISSLFSK